MLFECQANAVNVFGQWSHSNEKVGKCLTEYTVSNQMPLYKLKRMVSETSLSMKHYILH